MKLTRKKSIKLTIELWTWRAETGKPKEDWPKWSEYSDVWPDSFFCEYDTQMQARYKHNRDSCGYCPLVTSGLGSCDETYYEKWNNVKDPRTRKKYAKLFLEQLKTLK